MKSFILRHGKWSVLLEVAFLLLLPVLSKVENPRSSFFLCYSLSLSAHTAVISLKTVWAFSVSYYNSFDWTKAPPTFLSELGPSLPWTESQRAEWQCPKFLSRFFAWLIVYKVYPLLIRRKGSENHALKIPDALLGTLIKFSEVPAKGWAYNYTFEMLMTWLVLLWIWCLPWGFFFFFNFVIFCCLKKLGIMKTVLLVSFTFFIVCLKSSLWYF